MNTAVGSKDAPILFVMTHPPSDGMEAWMWRVVQQEAKIRKTDVRIIYLLDGPPENSGGRPSKSQLRNSHERVAREFAESSPKVVVPFGPDACRAAFGDVDEGIFDMRGYVVTSKFFGATEIESWEQCGVYKQGNSSRNVSKGDPKYKWVKRSLAGGYLGVDYSGVVIPTFTLDYVRKKQFAVKPAFTEDLRRVCRAASGALKVVDDGFKFYNTFITTRGYENKSDGAPISLHDVVWGDLIAVDIETHGIDNEVIDCVSFSDGVTTASLKWTSEVLLFMNELFSLPGRMYAIHNSPFDVPRLMASGVNISQDVLDNRMFDSMFAAVVIQPDLHKGLGRISTVFVDTYPWKWKSIKHGDAEFYSAKDSYVTAHLALSEIAVMKKLGCWNLFMGQGDYPGPGVMATIPLLTEMHRVGIKTDPGFAKTMFDKLSSELLAHEQQWAEAFPGVDPHSNKSVADFLYGTWKLPVQRTQEDGVTVDELALVRLRIYVDMHKGGDEKTGPWKDDDRCTPDVFTLLLKLRNASKILSTYVMPIMSSNQWVHPSYLPRAKDSDESGGKGNTATGRLATSNPNIQNQPKAVRYLYLPDNEDMVFIQADFKSAELYSMAHMARDERLLADLAGDMHTANAERFNTTRSTAKNVTYAGQYLAGASKVSEMILAQEHQYVPAAECAKILNGQAEYYHKTAAYKRYLTQLCETQKYIINPFGRIRFFHSGQAPAAVDYIPQSIVADVLWCVLKPVSDMAKRYGGRCTTTVHDSILIQVPKRHKEAAAKEMLEIMTKKFECVSPDFFIPVELEAAGAGEAWGHVKKYTP